MIIGRRKEKKRLEKAYRSKESELMVVYGRRRIGKIYLVREFFSEKPCHFVHVTGIGTAHMPAQLAVFTTAVAKTFFRDAPLAVPPTWDQAFQLLHQQIQEHPHQKTVIFLDELPWLASRRSNLMQVVDH